MIFDCTVSNKLIHAGPRQLLITKQFQLVTLRQLRAPTHAQKLFPPNSPTYSSAQDGSGFVNCAADSCPNHKLKNASWAELRGQLTVNCAPQQLPQLPQSPQYNSQNQNNKLLITRYILCDE